MKVKRKVPAVVRYLPTIIVFLLIFFIVIYAVSDVSKTTGEEGLAITENSIRRAVITCYAQEGSYPESIDYLKENYGLYVSDDYVVFYEIFATNIMPEITVLRKQVG